MNRSISRMIGMMVAVTVGIASEAGAAVKLPSVFSDHMVLQRDMAVPIWGTAAPGEKVTVKFRDQEQTTTAGTNGQWQVKLNPLKAGGPDQLVVNTVTNEDVLVGEVWVGSGQSNMQIGTSYFTRNDTGLALLVTNAPYQKLRLSSANKPWVEATAPDINKFSALLFAFGVRLQAELGVPVGLLIGAVGGTPSGYWVTKEMLAADPVCQALIAKSEVASPFAARQEKYEQDLAKYKVALAAWEKGITAATNQATPATMSAGAPVAAPDKAKLPPKPTIPIVPVRAGDAPGGVGHLYDLHIKPFLPFAIRGVLWDQGESNTALQGIDQYTTMGALISGWRRAWGEGEFPFIYIQKPSGGGCAWDKENPVTKLAEAFTPLPAQVPTDGQTVELFTKIMTYPNAAMAISSDLGSGLHPANKSGYGHRAADVALSLVYGKKIEYYGPLYAAHKIEGDKVRISFTHIGQGLAFKPGDKLQGFAIAGDDKQFHWADAVISGDTVILSCAAVPKPVFVRYAWSNNRRWANLFNKDGLPAIPFRTDF